MRGLDRSEDGWNSGCVLERGGEAAAVLTPNAGRIVAVARAAERFRRVLDVGREPRDRGVACPDALCEQTSQLLQSLARLGGNNQERRTAHTVLGQKAADIGAPGVDVTWERRSAWFRTTAIASPCEASGRR